MHIQIIQIIVGLTVAILALKYAMKHVVKIESHSVKEFCNWSSDYGIGIITGTLVTATTYSPIFILLYATILYCGNIIKLRQVSFLIIGVALGLSITGWTYHILLIPFALIFFYLTSGKTLRRNLFRKEPVSSETRTIIGFTIAVIGLEYFTVGWKLFGDSTKQLSEIFIARELFQLPYLYGMISTSAQSSSVGMGIIIYQMMNETISIEFATKATASTTLFSTLYIFIPMLLINKKSIKPFSIYLGLALITIIVSLVLHTPILSLIDSILTSTTSIIETKAKSDSVTIAMYHSITIALATLFTILGITVFSLYKKINGAYLDTTEMKSEVEESIKEYQ